MGLNLVKAEMVKAQQDAQTTHGNTNGNDKLIAQEKLICAKPSGYSSNKSSVSSEMIDEWRELVDEVLENAQNSVDVLNDLLNYDKIEVGTFNLELEVVPIAQLLAKTVNEFKLPAGEKQVDLSLQLEEECVGEHSACSHPTELRKMMSVADPFRLSQVTRNLISNAIKFTPSQGESCSSSCHSECLHRLFLIVRVVAANDYKRQSSSSHVSKTFIKVLFGDEKDAKQWARGFGGENCESQSRGDGLWCWHDSRAAIPALPTGLTIQCKPSTRRKREWLGFVHCKGHR